MRPFCGGIHKSVEELAQGGMYVMGHVGNREVEILVDSGANISLVNYDVFVQLEGPGETHVTPLWSTHGNR